MLAGPSALAFVSGDPVEAAKGLRAFAKGNPALVIKGGVMEGKVLSAAEVSKLADLESREVLLSKMAGAMKASMSGAASLFAAPLSQTARLVEALRQKVEEQGPAATEAAPAAEADGTTAEAPAEADEKTRGSCRGQRDDRRGTRRRGPGLTGPPINRWPTARAADIQRTKGSADHGEDVYRGTA